MFRWIVTKDGFDDFQGRVGYGNAEEEQCQYKWRVIDEDDMMHYEGLSNDKFSQSAFIPLDWAMRDSGATDIQYWDGRRQEWVTL